MSDPAPKTTPGAGAAHPTAHAADGGACADPCAGVASFDAMVLRELIDIAGLEAIRPVVDVFWSTAADLTAAMRAALAAGDLNQFGRAAHSLKGSCANVGAARAAEIAKLLERPDPATAGRLLDELDAALEAARPDLSRLVAA